MNVQAHMSGQVSNQGTMSQQNGNSQMQNLVGGGSAPATGAGLGPSRVSPVDNDILKLRQAMRIRM
jgi:E1A/CREB-binding protein